MHHDKDDQPDQEDRQKHLPLQSAHLPKAPAQTKEVFKEEGFRVIAPLGSDGVIGVI